MIWEEIKAEVDILETDEQALRKFGFTMAIVLGLFSLLALYRQSGAFPYVFLPAIAFWLAGTLHSPLLKDIYIWWMTLAVTLGYFVTRIILSVVFYVAFTIIGFFARLFTSDMLDERLDASATTYWQPYEHKKPLRERLERQF